MKVRQYHELAVVRRLTERLLKAYYSKKLGQPVQLHLVSTRFIENRITPQRYRRRQEVIWLSTKALTSAQITTILSTIQEKFNLILLCIEGVQSEPASSIGVKVRINENSALTRELLDWFQPGDEVFLEYRTPICINVN